jgi:formate-dependent nitrite reductase membrane component NrfD
MLLERLNDTHWTWLVYVEMLIAGIAAGAIVAAAILELSGRGQSPAARTARLIAFPLMVLSGLLLIADLSRPARFWHMVVMSERLLPMLKPWSPMSMGTVVLTLFSGACFVSFVDALIARRTFRIFGWRHDRTLHGGPLGVVWSVISALLAFAVGIYSGVLLTTSSIPGWGHNVMIPAVFVATALITGVAAVVFARAILGQVDSDVLSLAQTNLWLIGWWLVTVVVFLLTVLGTSNASVYLAGVPLVAILLAILLAGLIPIVLQAFRPLGLTGSLALSSALVLIGGLFVRYGIVMGPQLQ